MSVELRDGGEELSPPAVKRKCVHEENSLPLVSGLGPSIYGESVAPPRHLTHQHQHPHPRYQHHSPQHEGQHPHRFNSQPPSYSQPQETPEYRVFREHYDRLVTAISDPLLLATRLFSRSIIDYALLQRVTMPTFTSLQNTITLLTAVLGKIQSDPSTFSAFFSALNEDPSMQLLLESMQGM